MSHLNTSAVVTFTFCFVLSATLVILFVVHFDLRRRNLLFWLSIRVILTTSSLVFEFSIKMSSTVARKTYSATLVIDKFSQMTEWKDVPINGLSYNYFGIQPKTVVYTGEYVSIYFLSSGNTFKYKANVSVLNSQRDKFFTKEYFGDFKDAGNNYDDDYDENYFHLMPRSDLLSPEKGYLFNDKLTLLCELEVLEEGENPKTAQSIRKDLNNLSENLQSVLIDGKFTDFTLVVGNDGKEFNVHKAILAARSSVFAAMFEHDCEEKRLNKVNITDMDEDVCGEMMSYIYTGKVKELDRFAMELLVSADKYQLHSLKSICEQFMCANLSAETVCKVLILADLHQATDLKAKCIEYIAANVEQVETTEGWKVLDTNVKLVKELFIYSAKKI